MPHKLTANSMYIKSSHVAFTVSHFFLNVPCLLFFQDSEDFLQVVRHQEFSCKSMSQLCHNPAVNGPMGHLSTIPWSVLVLKKVARTPVRVTQEAPWCVNLAASSTLRVWCHGDMDVPPRVNMASTLGSATWGHGSPVQCADIKNSYACKHIKVVGK